jgi:ferredoxin
MPENTIPIHYVSTLGEAKELCHPFQRFWVSNCGCREGNKKGCRQSRSDVCLMFSEGQNASGSGKREITRAEVEDIFAEAGSKNLVARPFRSDDRTKTDGICFCCHDCCGYFLDPKETCAPGALIEKTSMGECTHCGACESVCYFRARKMMKNELAVDQSKCYGCGLCVPACPAGCVSMAARK